MITCFDCWRGNNPAHRQGSFLTRRTTTRDSKSLEFPFHTDLSWLSPVTKSFLNLLSHLSSLQTEQKGLALFVFRSIRCLHVFASKCGLTLAQNRRSNTYNNNPQASDTPDTGAWPSNVSLNPRHFQTRLSRPFYLISSPFDSTDRHSLTSQSAPPIWTSTKYWRGHYPQVCQHPLQRAVIYFPSTVLTRTRYPNTYER